MKALNKYLNKFSLNVKKEKDTLFVYQDNKIEMIIHLGKNLSKIKKKIKIREGVISKQKIDLSKIKENKLDFYHLIKKDEEIGDIIINEIYV